MALCVKQKKPCSIRAPNGYVLYIQGDTISVVYGVFHGNEDTQNLSISSRRSTYDDLHRVFMLSH